MNTIIDYGIPGGYENGRADFSFQPAYVWLS
ncbi:hypothetical protein CYPRO_0127 [Cyclonatronum proteinivorum]|uniref:Uncharacterized protein n=1 Tax=Cyclonatronum proteinivorum TaxID=1457365 RepID=A0A345UG13_9BACT|nr:hypothetical protein CYPRO_0127 [Cyclonatronum proteinivorum]